jgi:superfamily I DNA/RNA helicase
MTSQSSQSPEPHFLEGLNQPQKQAVETVDGRVLILAGAGSGKTRVLTTRMAYLVKNLNVPPKSILGLTFTNKAAAEMRHRIGTLIPANAAKQITLSTFHSFCLDVLRNDAHQLGYTQQFSLYDEKDVQRLVTLIARDLLDHEGTMPSLTDTISIITRARNQGLNAEEIGGSGSTWHDEFNRSVYQRLQDSLRAYNAMDFDNLICLTVALFEQFPTVLEKYQERFRYIMIDEYQDTNPIQSRLASCLSAKYQNLCVVGDDDQSIYGWRGAEVKNILRFDKSVVITLEQNFRSTNNILNAANAVIRNNKERHPKALWSDRGNGDLIEVFHAPNEKEEAEAVVRRLIKLHGEKQISWKDMAILYRSNALSQQLELALAAAAWKDGDQWMRGIPYQVFGGQEFYERREVKDLFAYLRVIINPLDQEALLRVINQPRRGIGDAALDALTAYNRSQKIPLWTVLQSLGTENMSLNSQIELNVTTKASEGIKTFVNLIQEAGTRFKGPSMKEALSWLIEKINYRKAINEEVKSDQMRAFKWENVETVVKAIGDYEQDSANNAEKPASLQDFITSSSLGQNNDNFRKKDLQANKVNLMTFHSAKGLEFSACFLVGVEDHIIPHEKSMKETGLDEERRLMYVAMTRAKQYLTISMAKQRKRMGKDSASRPSRFLFEIPQELLNSTRFDKN